MKPKAFRWVKMATSAGLLLGGAAFAADSSNITEQKSYSRPASTSKENQRQVTFTVKKVDPQTHTALLQVKVSPEANITESGAPIKLDDLKPGDSIRASFDPQSQEVTRVDVLKHEAP